VSWNWSAGIELLPHPLRIRRASGWMALPDRFIEAHLGRLPQFSLHPFALRHDAMQR